MGFCFGLSASFAVSLNGNHGNKSESGGGLGRIIPFLLHVILN